MCLAVYVPGQAGIPPVDRDESRFAQASRQMVESGDWVVPRIQDRPRLNKPPLIYWVQGAAVAALGDRGRPHEGIWVYRLPSLLAAVTTVFLTWRLGLSMFDPRVAWLGAAMLAVSPLFAWEAHQARADQLLVTTVVATQFALWRVWRIGRSSSQAGSHLTRPDSAPPPSMSSMPAHLPRAPVHLCLLFWMLLGLGIMTKGPITPMIASLTAIALCIAARRWRWLLTLRPLLGLVVVAAVVAPWVYLVGERVGWAHYLQTIYEETLGRAGAPMEGHWGPPGYHLVVLTVLFWPGTLLTAAAVGAAFRRAVWIPPRDAGSSWLARLGRRASGRAPELFLLAWLIPSWLVFELASTKLPHYAMPLYPAVALLSARAVLGAAARGGRRSFGDRAGLVAWFLVGLVLVVAIPLASIGLSMGRPGNSALVAAAGALAAATALLVAVRSRRIIRTQVAGVIAAAIGLATLVGAILPSMQQIWISPRLIAIIDEADPGRERAVGLVGYHEDSMIFLTRGRAVRLSLDDVPAWLAKNPEGLIAVATAPGGGISESVSGVRELGRISGFNYSKGRQMDVVLTEAER